MYKLKPIIEFKEHYLEFEFLHNTNLDTRLKIITLALAGHVYFNFGKSLMITEIFRTQKMQDKYYSHDINYQNKPWQSVHQFWRGIDFSLKYFTNDEIESIEKFLNTNFIYSSHKNILTCKIHSVKNWGWHLHVQVDSDNITSIKKNN